MKSLNFLFVALTLCFASIAHATIISGNHVTAGGKTVNLQGLEWLSLDETANVSRTNIEAGYGNFLNNGWTYASRAQTETLLGSLWGGTYDGYSADNADGASWFISNFGALREGGDFNSQNITGWNIANFFFGLDGECKTDVTLTCVGYTIKADNYVASLTAFNVIDQVIEVSNPGGAGPVGKFVDNYGVSMGVTDENAALSKSFNAPSYGSLLVRTAAAPEPSAIALMGLGLLGFGVTRRKQKKN